MYEYVLRGMVAVAYAACNIHLCICCTLYLNIYVCVMYLCTLLVACTCTQNLNPFIFNHLFYLKASATLARQMTLMLCCWYFVCFYFIKIMIIVAVVVIISCIFQNTGRVVIHTLIFYVDVCILPKKKNKT